MCLKVSHFSDDILAANDHKVKKYCQKKTTSGGPMDTADQETVSNSPPKPELIPSNIFSEIFPSSFKQALEEIEISPIHNLFGKSPVSEIATYCKGSEIIMNEIKKTFGQLASTPVNIVLSEDRENLFRRIHVMRFSEEIKILSEKIETSECPFPDSINHFLQIFLLQFTKSVLDEFAKTKKVACSEETKTMTANDQKVLFYLAGYIISALTKKFKRLKDEKLKEFKFHVIDSLQTNEKHCNYLSKYTSMFEKKNRGGLKYPSENTFLLIRSMEIVTRKHTASKMTTKSIEKSVLKEIIMEDFMVKYYAEQLFTVETQDMDDDNFITTQETVATDFTEDITNLFLTVRGFAVARVERNKIKTKLHVQKTCTPGESLRGALREKCLNKN